ncbi:hypothetical protein ACLB2K_048945 [Fragaria x ananassa]
MYITDVETFVEHFASLVETRIHQYQLSLVKFTRTCATSTVAIPTCKKRCGEQPSPSATCYSLPANSPPPPPPIRVSNHVAKLGPPKAGPKPRQLLSLPRFPAGRHLPGKKSYHDGAVSHVTAVSRLRYYFHEIDDAAIRSHFNIGLVQMECPSSIGKHMRKIRPSEVMEEGRLRRVKFLGDSTAYRDSAIIVLNKPPKLPVKGNVPVHNSMDALAAAALSYDYDEGPKLAWNDACRAKCQRYWALVIGSPKEKEGLIYAPLTKVLLDDGKTERVILAHQSGLEASQQALTQYQVLGPTINGCSWIELQPLTSGKHQLRVHCAEALGTPIVGDYKYGWFVHRRWKIQPDTHTPSSLTREKQPLPLNTPPTTPKYLDKSKIKEGRI